jgi:hypothetical protein
MDDDSKEIEADDEGTFDLDAWITQNDLTQLKETLISLQFTTKQSILSMTEPLIDFIL